MKYSVVIRGKIFPHTQETINSIRAWFDGEIILSTWKDQEIEKITGYSKVVLSPDPGAGPVQQMKRQLVSYKNGLQESTGEVVLVTRSDMVHYKNPFDYFGKLQNKNEIFRIFEERVIIGNMMTIHPERNCPGETNEQRYFRLNDWFRLA